MGGKFGPLDHALDKMVDKPIRLNNTLDLLATNWPNQVNRVEIMPDISDHSTIFVETSIKTAKLRQMPRKIIMYKKADWDSITDGL